MFNKESFQKKKKKKLSIDQLFPFISSTWLFTMYDTANEQEFIVNKL